MERKCLQCPAFYEVTQENLIPTGAGWRNVQIDGKDVILCRPGTTIQKKRYMDKYCYYCLACTKGKKIGSKASWTGRTPIWCPLGREIPEKVREA